MPPKTTGWDELHLAENPAIELLESLGYTYVPPEGLEAERASFKKTILTDRLAAAVKRLNPWRARGCVSITASINTSSVSIVASRIDIVRSTAESTGDHSGYRATGRHRPGMATRRATVSEVEAHGERTEAVARIVRRRRRTSVRVRDDGGAGRAATV